MERIPKKGDFGENEKAQEEFENLEKSHVSDLFDSEEDIFGERADPVTGELIDNTRDTSADEALRVVTPGNNTEDALPSLGEDDDEAARWLREHDT